MEEWDVEDIKEVKKAKGKKVAKDGKIKIEDQSKALDFKDLDDIIAQDQIVARKEENFVEDALKEVEALEESQEEVRQKVVRIFNTTKQEYEYHVVPEGFVGTEASEVELTEIAKLVELSKDGNLAENIKKSKNKNMENYFSASGDTYKSVAAPHLREKIKEEKAKEPEPEPEILVWKNPKSRVRNNKVVEVGDRVLIHEKPLDCIVTNINEEGTCAISSISTSTTFSVPSYEVYPIYANTEEIIKVGNLIEWGHERGIVTKIEKEDIVSHGIRIPKEAIERIYTRNQPKVPCSTYTCGAVLFKNKTYADIAALTDKYPGTKFIQETLLYPLEFMNIANHYKVAANDIVPKEQSIDKVLKRTLNHPLNVAKKEWALLVGPSGSGKTEMAIGYATSEGKEYVKLQGNMQVTQDDLIGYKSVTTGVYFRSLLREAVEFGKIFILDEVDACNPNTLLVLNGLKQDFFQFPDTLVEVHKDFKLIATANTLEFNEEYNARTPVDKATKTRFKIIEYHMSGLELAVRYGLKYIKQISNIDRLTPREVDRMVTEFRIDEMEAEEALLEASKAKQEQLKDIMEKANATNIAKEGVTA